MKKISLALAFAMAYAIFLSLGFECMLRFLGAAMAISIDGSSVTRQYPRFIPFCLVAGIVASAAIIGIFILNVIASEKNELDKRLWTAELILAFVISLPMIKPWEILFDFLQKTF